MYKFSARKIAEMSAAIEEEGARFYAQLANTVQDEKIKKTALFFSEQEKAHQRTFQNIASAYRDSDEVHEYAIDVAEYLRLSIQKIKETAFNPKHLKETPFDLRKVLEVAIYTEMQAIRVYSELCNASGERFQKILSQIRDEEKKHLEMLLAVKKKAGM